jgi:hypothetical protein
MNEEVTTKQWAELCGNALTLSSARIVGRDDDDDDILADVTVTESVALPDDNDDTWINALSDLGYRPLADTVAFNGETITFLVENI